MRVAVVGHVEWVDFLVVDGLPEQGEIQHVRSASAGPGGGGAMAARALLALTGSPPLFVTAVGDDPLGARAADELRSLGLDARTAVRREVPQRRAITFLDEDAERTIVIVGERIVPHGDDDLGWDDLAGCDGVYFTGGDAEALRRARAARVVVATPRARGALAAAGVDVDALVGSSSDQHEVIGPELLARARHVVQTEGARGGAWRGPDGTSGRWEPVPLARAPVDAYGCGDSFAAALTFGLAEGRGIQGACELAARVGAAVLCERAPAMGDLAALR